MKTVKVRVCVAVDADGFWEALGRSECSDRVVADAVRSLVPGALATYWLTAELAVPEEVEVEAQVES